MDIDLIRNDYSLEPTNLILGVKNEQNESIELLNKISFTNSR
jgi:hypothetical protein